jgi:autotransporter adhesin
MAGGLSAQTDPNSRLPLPFNTSNTTAIGVGAQAGATADGQNNATALGQAAQANALNATALGQGAVASAINSVAIGQGSIAGQPNTVSVGAPGAERRITNVAAGTNATDAVNVGQLESALGGAPIVTTTTNTGSGGGGGVSPAALAGLQNQVNGVQTQIFGIEAFARRSREESRQGVAAAVAMGSASMPSAPGRTTWAGNTSLYNGAVGVGGSVAHRLDTVIPLAVTAGYAYGGNRGHVARAGLEGEF